MFSPCIFTLYLMISIDPKTQPWGWKYANHGVSLTRTSRDVSTLGHMILSTVFKSFSSTFSFHFFLLLFLKCKIRFRTYFILHPLHPLKQCLNQNIQIAYPVGLPVMLNRMRVPRILSAGVILTRFILFLNTFFSQFVETILLPIILSGGPIPIRLDVGFPFSPPFLTSLKIKKSFIDGFYIFRLDMASSWCWPSKTGVQTMHESVKNQNWPCWILLTRFALLSWKCHTQEIYTMENTFFLPWTVWHLYPIFGKLLYYTGRLGIAFHLYCPFKCLDVLHPKTIAIIDFTLWSVFI